MSGARTRGRSRSPGGSMRDRYRAVIIGAGNAGAGYDRPDSVVVLSHAHAVLVSPQFHLAGFVDPDWSRALAAQKAWGGEAYRSIAEAFSHAPFDVAIVAAPDACHHDLLVELLRLPLKLIIAEKPLVRSLAQAAEVQRLHVAAGVPLVVNYTRRFIPEYRDLRSRIASGDYGSYLCGTGYYGKGVLHNGSHMIDLLHFFLGHISGHRVVAVERDYAEDDPSVSASLQLANGGTFSLLHVNHANYSIFEMDLLFEKQRVRMAESGMLVEMFDVQADATVSGFRMLGRSSAMRIPVDRGLRGLYAHASDCLEGRAAPACGVAEATEALRACIALSETAQRP